MKSTVLAAPVMALVIALPMASPVVWAAPSPESCPSNEILGAPSTAPQAKKSSSYGFELVQSAQYDLVAGTMSGKYWTIYPGGGTVTLVFVNDEYTIQGLPAGTQVPIVVELTCSASVNSGSQYSFWLSGPGGLTASHTGGVSPWNGTVDLAVTVTAGQPFLVHYAIRAITNAHGLTDVNASARFRFLGPPGGAIVSCQGYSQETPTHAQTWGSVKAAYR